MKGYTQVPQKLKYSPVLARLSSFDSAFFLWSQLAKDPRNRLPYDAVILRSEVWPARSNVGLADIARARDNLVSLGVYIRHSNERRVWLEIAKDYRHAEGENETSFGDDEPGQEQMEMPLPMLLRKKQPAENRREKKKSPESARELQSVEKFPSGSDSVNQDLSIVKGNQENRFAAGKSDMPDDPLWQSLIKAVNPSEMLRHGLLWKKRIIEDRDAMATALSDWWAMMPENRAKYNAAAYITKAFENEKRKFA